MNRIIGYTHNPSASTGPAHAVTEFGNGAPVLACGAPGYAMDHIALRTDPDRQLCVKCAEKLREELLWSVVDRFGSGKKFSDAEASGFLRDLARRTAFALALVQS